MSGTYQLKSCVWEITLGCCFSCRYCGSGGGRARDNELTTDECLSVADELAALGCERVSLIGGEVFMRRDWEDIIRRLTGHGISVAVITNGWLFREDMIRKLKALDVESVAVSLDGLRDVHDKYRQAGSFDRALRAIDSLTAGGVPTSVISTLNAENAQSLPAFYELLRTKDICAWQLQACSPMGNAAKGGIDYRFDFGKVISFVASIMYTSAFPVGIADNIGYFTADEGALRGNLSGCAYFQGCRAGLTTIGIDSIGNVRGCESMYDDCFIDGNVRTRPLADIWNDPEAFAYNRKFDPSMLTGGCASCAYGPFCGGGCRSYNHFVHGRLYESPFCAIKMNKEDGHEQ